MDANKHTLDMICNGAFWNGRLSTAIEMAIIRLRANRSASDDVADHLSDTLNEYRAAQNDRELVRLFDKQDAQRRADRIDGYDRDDLGESPDH